MHSYGRVPSLHSRPTSEQLRRFSLANRQPIAFHLHRMLIGMVEQRNLVHFSFDNFECPDKVSSEKPAFWEMLSRRSLSSYCTWQGLMASRVARR